MLDLKRTIYWKKWYWPVLYWEIVGEPVLAGYYVIRGNWLVREDQDLSIHSQNAFIFVDGHMQIDGILDVC